MIDSDTIYEIGSVTKTFIAVAIGILVDKGKMKWNDAVKKHVA